jgi:hypothetical protein
MRLTDLQHGEITPVLVTIPAKHERALVNVADKPLRLSRPTPASAVLLVHDRHVCELHGRTIADEDQLHAIVERGLPRVVRLTTPRRGAAGVLDASLHVHEFHTELVVAEPLELDVDERLLEKLRTSRRLGPRGDLPAALARLTEWFLFTDTGSAGRRAACMTLGRDAETAISEGFWLHGRTVSASVQRTAEGRMLVQQITPSRRGHDRRADPPRLLRGDLRFVDATLASRLRPVAARELDALVRSADSYLGRWEEINQIERRLVTERARSLGTLRYERRTRTTSGDWRFHLTPSYDRETVRRFAEHRREEFAADAQLPPELEVERPGERVARGGQALGLFTGELTGADPDTGYVELRCPRSRRTSGPPASGFLFVSGLGDEARLDRRARARDAIVGASCPMPQLGLVLEGYAPAHARGREQAAVPSTVLRCFRAAPTPRQLEALRVAINTPDIALIQGPPGTGKTDVIAALERWLAELTGTRGGIAKSVLLTSYQHDAVDNAAGRSRVLELPALRVGGRRRETGDELATDALAWGAALASELGSRLQGSGALLQAARKLQGVVRGYALVPTSPAGTAEILEEVATLGEDLLSTGLRDRLREHAATLRRAARQTPPDEARARDLRTAARALRTTATAFADDGAASAQRLLARLREDEQTSQADRDLLAHATRARLPDEHLLAALAALRDRLLDGLRADRGPVGATAPDIDARALLNEAASAAGARVRGSRDAVGRIQAQLVEDLEHDPHAVMDAVSHYTAIVAATCQQSASTAMTAAAGVEFDTVIVDEAARANPLDLMIPLAQARRRIVLVGDHRQLPHVLEPEVERELGGDVEEQTRLALQQSLFERLFEQFQREEREGGPRRVVTLDTQFRMHPLLGDFVSRAFYEPHGTQLHSGRPASDFAIALPGLPRTPAAWIDLPRASHGEERRVGSSKSRPDEAAWIASRLAQLMEAEPQLSFGVISFYKAQVQEIERVLEEREMLVRDDEGELTVAPAWRELVDPATGQRTARLRIGTVDAFQGREFDVVLLSLTRASTPGDSLDPRALRRRYGHLLLANRLCVAMSRQRRMLVVVGDRELAVGRQARAAVPALVAFRELCEEEVRDDSEALAIPA